MSESPLARLARRPARFRFGAAMRLLWLASGRRDPGEAVRFTTPASLAHPVAEVDAASLETGARISTRLIGLTGAPGPLPRWYTELVAQSLRARSPSLAAFLDLLAQRLIGAFAGAGVKYHPHLAVEIAARTGEKNTAPGDPGEDQAGRALLALAGYGTRNLLGRLEVGAPAIQHYAGFFASHPRSAERLRAMVSDWLERPVTVIEFAGSWLRLEAGQQSRMPRGRIPGQFNRLGTDCAAGARAFDQQARFILRIGPLSHAEFTALLPDKPVLPRLVSLVRAYVGMEVDFAVNLVLDPEEIPPPRLGGADGPRLGWTGWLPASRLALPGPRRADQAMFSAAMIESLPGRMAT